MAEFIWRPPGDSEPKSFPLTHTIQLSFNILLSPCPDGLDAAICSWTKHAHTCWPPWQVHWDLGLRLRLSQCLSSLLEGLLAGGDSVTMGYWNWTFVVQSWVEKCFVKLQFDSCTLCTEPPIHIGMEARITDWRPKTWSNSESPCFPCS